MSAILALIHQNPIVFGAIIGVIGVVLYFILQAATAVKEEQADHSVDTTTVYTRKEIAKHNTPNDLWCIVCDRVYNITRFVPFHPGGDLLFKHAGGDATLGFFGVQHPSRVFNEIHDYQIGVLAKAEYAKWDMQASEIDKHNKNGDCWVCIEERVYNVSEWMKTHPGGAEALIKAAGFANKTATTEKFDKIHKKETKEQIHQYFIGYTEKKPEARIKEYNVAQEKMSDSPRSTDDKKPAAAKQLGSFTKEEVAKHNTPKDLWVIVNKKVYNLTEFEHPGGAEPIHENAGKDATKGFTGLPHPPYVATEVLPQYLIGNLSE